MKRTHLNRWTPLLLALFLARAFVPAGFMLSADASGLSLVFCTSISAPETTSAHAGHHDHAGHHGKGGGDQQTQGMGECPFAVGSVLLSHSVPVTAPDPLPDLYVLTLDSELPRGFKLLRSQSIRGPPALA